MIGIQESGDQNMAKRGKGRFQDNDKARNLCDGAQQIEVKVKTGAGEKQPEIF